MKRILIISILAGALGSFGIAQSLTLDSCKVYALENNKKLKEAQLEVEAAKQVKKEAFTNYFPTVNAGAVAMKANRSLLETEIPEMNLPVYDGNPANIGTATQFAYFPGMEVSVLDYTNIGMVTAIQPLYVGGRVRNGNKLASLGEEFSEHNLHLTTEEILVATEYYYWTILALEEKEQTLNSYEKLLNNLKNDVGVAYEAGLIQKSDLLKIELELNDIKAKKLKLDNALSLLKAALAQHIGIAYSDSLTIADTSISIESPTVFFENPNEALQNRNEYQMLNTAIEAEVLQKKMARGEIMPSLSVGVQGLYLDLAEQQNNYGLAFATVSIPISGWWGGAHKIKEHQIKVNIAENNLAEKSELIKLQMDKSFKDLNESFEQIAIAELSVSQSAEHLSVVFDNYNAGIVGTSDLLEAQAIHQNTLDTLVDAKTTYKVKQAYYLQAIGNLI